MKKAKKVVLLIGSHLLVAVLCFGVALFFFEHKAKAVINEGNNMLNDMALVSRYAAYASMQQVYGNPDAFKEALMLYSNALDFSKGLQSPMFSENSYQTDKMLISVNLSKVERKKGNIEEAENLLKKAQEHCNATQMKDCSFEKILLISRIMEENNMFANKSEPNHEIKADEN
jgi:hypothetical protein